MRTTDIDLLEVIDAKIKASENTIIQADLEMGTIEEDFIKLRRKLTKWEHIKKENERELERMDRLTHEIKLLIDIIE